jgi:hypothetical protein
VSLKDKVVKALAIRWARGKVKDLRGKEKETTMGKVLQFLDGWKLVIGVVGLFGVNVWDAYHNGHAGQIVGSILVTLGWLPPGEWTGEAMTKAALAGVALWGFFSKLYKAQAQVRAGSSISGALSTEGYVSKYVSDAMAGKPVVPVARVENDVK